MEPCTIETGLLRKKPCGHPATTHCLNCERALCSQHAVAQLTEAGKHSGKFLCKECQSAWKDIAKSTPVPTPPVVKKPAEKPAGAPAAPHGAAPAAPKPAAGQPAAKTAEAKPAEAKAPEKPAESSGMIEFTPTKKP